MPKCAYLSTKTMQLEPSKKKYIRQICFGAMSVAEEFNEEKDLSKLSSEECTQIVHSGYVISSDKVPELFYNASLKVQLACILKKEGFIVQTKENNENMSLLPYNVYYRSEADIVVTKSPEESESESETPSVLVTELKKGFTVTQKMRAQAHAEAFNVGVSHLIRSCHEDYSALRDRYIEIYCILSFSNCKRGKVSKMTISSSKCEVVEDTARDLL